MNTTAKINVAKIATCNSLSGLTELQYHLGYEAGTKDKLYIRISASNGNGKFNACWWSLAEIDQALAAFQVGAAFTASALKPVFAGRSVNTLYFVLAALLDYGVLSRAVPVEAGYVRNGTAALISELQSLAEAGVNLVPDAMTEVEGHTVSPAAKAGKGAKKSAPSAKHA